jgi:hypothetical protein
VQLAQSENGDPEVTVEILSVDLSIVEPNGANPDRGLRAETRFEIAGTGANMLTEAQIGYRNDVQIVNLESGEATVVASTEGQLQPQQLTYTSPQTFAIPAVGLYELQSIIKLLRPSGTISVLGQGPNLRVVPQE